MSAETEMRWAAAWEELYQRRKVQPNAPIVTPEFIELSLEEAQGWLQDSVYQGFEVSLEATYFRGVVAIKLVRTPWVR